MDELVGASLGQYKIIEHLADGGMASVYLAHQPTMSRNVAIKLLGRAYTEDKAFIDRFYSEVEIIAKLQHPHILPVYDFGTYKETPYIVMAYLNGGTLADQLGQNPMSIPNMMRITQQISEALMFAHSKNIIHRDLKPANVLMDELGNAYLADFGLAKITDQGNNASQTGIVGTPYYVAPEMIQSQPVTKSVDMYALGIILYEMLTGDVPYRDDSSLMKVFLAHINEPIPQIHEQRPDLPEAIQNIIDRGMAKSPEDRYQTGDELLEDLRRVLQPENIVENLQPALLMTDINGHVIFLDQQCLSILKRQQHEARTIIGKPVSSVLGMDVRLSEQILQTVKANGEVDNLAITIVNSRGDAQDVWCSAMATRDDKGEFIGSDIKLIPAPKDPDRPASSEFLIMMPDVNTQEQSFVQDYFVMQIEGLYRLTQNWAGRKVAANFETIMNELATRNNWDVEMKRGKLNINQIEVELDVYKALVARGMAYVAHIIGSRQVIKELDHLNKKVDANVLIFVRTLGYDKMYEEILN